MTHLLVVIALISYRSEISPCAYALKLKSIGVKGLNPYTISNGENSVVEYTL
jgi:hypothetical protein